MSEPYLVCGCQDGPHKESDYPEVDGVRRCGWCRWIAVTEIPEGLENLTLARPAEVERT